MITVAPKHAVQNDFLMVPTRRSPTVDNSANDHHFLRQGRMSEGFKKIPACSRNVDTTIWQQYRQTPMQKKLPIRGGTLYNTLVEYFLGGESLGGGKSLADGKLLFVGARSEVDGISEGVGDGGGVPTWGEQGLL